ncbi:MAG TPA: thioredoxin [bacterium]|nr:thioredoxin [bacterium]
MEITLTEKNFQKEVLESDIPVLVDFWAEWCAPCRMIAPVIEEIAQEYSGRLKVGKLNVDENQNLAAKYSIRSIPTLLIFKEGKVIEQIIGALPKKALKSKIATALAREEGEK